LLTRPHRRCCSRELSQTPASLAKQEAAWLGLLTGFKAWTTKPCTWLEALRCQGRGEVEVMAAKDRVPSNSRVLSRALWTEWLAAACRSGQEQ
jgi:hypothetical protein